MKWIENFKLKLRANKYKHKDDIGGVDYLFKTIQPGQTILDIGAHKGGYLYLMLELVGKNGKIVAFEPQSLLHAYLSKMKKVLSWQNVTVEHIALSDTETETTLFIPTNNVSSKSAPGATILNNRERDDIGFTEKVSTDSLDHYCSTHNIAPDFLKIDVEGNELNIFKGGMKTLAKYKPRIIVECDAGYVGEAQVWETFALLQGLGYTGSFIFEAARLPLSEFNFETYQNRNSDHFFCNNFIFE
ncbi:MAG: FkbM family methyltransferase [Sediminibacterium sp.]